MEIILKKTIRKIVDILVYRPDVSQQDKEELIAAVGEDGLFLGLEEIKDDDTTKEDGHGDDTPCKMHHATLTKFNDKTLGIKASTWDDKIFYFYTITSNEVENAMNLMGYDSHGYWLDFFDEPNPPETPPNYKKG